MRWLATAVEEAVVDGVADEAVAAAVEVVAIGLEATMHPLVAIAAGRRVEGKAALPAPHRPRLLRSLEHDLQTLYRFGVLT
jgi:hypothetical protein